MTAQGFGLSGRIARTFINTPVTPMLLIGALCMGLLGLFFTPRQEDPKISVPMIDIFVQYPGASAQQVESLVTEPLERLMMELIGVRHVYSATERGGAIVTVRFLVGEDLGESIVKVHDKLQSNMDRMPPDVRPPLVKPMSVDDVPIVTLTLWSVEIGDSQLRALALDVLQELGSVADTGEGFVVGGREEQIRVEVTRNYGQTANAKVNELLQAMFEAALIVSVLCLIGLGLRAAVVVIAVIPVVILLTIWWAWVVDYSIDRVSLFALIFAIGILVDDATVVVENIFRHWLELGQTSIREAVAAVDEVGNPTILATFTIIAALLPMGWVSGLMGPYMRPIPVLGSSAMFFSLIAAFVFTPWFALRVRPRMKALGRAERREEKTRQVVSRLYRPLVNPLIDNRLLGIAFLVGTIVTAMLVCTLFYFKVVPVKMLPFDNKPEFSVVVDLPEGTALPETANVLRQLAEEVRRMPEVVAVQAYAGTAQPFNFNGLVRHYYLRDEAWNGDLLVMLKDKHERARGSHAIAVAARDRLTPLAGGLGARIAVVEMPPGPPVLQTVVAEVYGPSPQARRQAAADLTRMFEQVDGIVDVDNYMIEPYSYWRFDVDTEKAVRQGISVDTINRNIAMAMGSERVGDVKRGTVQEPTYIVIQVPLSYRSEIQSLGSLPIQAPSGQMLPLAELGRFVRRPAEPIIYHKDLRPMEYVVGEMEGRLGAPIYGMLGVEDLLDDYDPPGPGTEMSGMPEGLIGPPATDAVVDFEWTGEWTVTYETFRDMGLAFMAALVLIYGLIVWEFRNFALAGLIMSPIPLTLIGIIPGHLLMGAEFTATSMIGMIALGGIIVRQSILIVEFVKIEVARGKRVREAAVAGAETRVRLILITSLTLMAGAWAIIQDPIFQGMAVSLLFGAGVATLMAVIVIPLGCISLRRQFYLQESESGEMELSSRYELIELGADGSSRSAHRAAGADSATVHDGAAFWSLWPQARSVMLSIVSALNQWGSIMFGILSNLIQRLLGGKSTTAGRPAAPPSEPSAPEAEPQTPASASEPSATAGAPAAAQEPGPPAAKKTAAKKAAAKKATTKKTPTKKASAKKTATKKAPAKQADTPRAATTKKTPTKKAAPKKAAVKKTTTKKAPPPDESS